MSGTLNMEMKIIWTSLRHKKYGTNMLKTYCMSATTWWILGPMRWGSHCIKSHLNSRGGRPRKCANIKCICNPNSRQWHCLWPLHPFCSKFLFLPVCTSCFLLLWLVLLAFIFPWTHAWWITCSCTMISYHFYPFPYLLTPWKPENKAADSYCSTSHFSWK